MTDKTLVESVLTGTVIAWCLHEAGCNVLFPERHPLQEVMCMTVYIHPLFVYSFTVSPSQDRSGVLLNPKL